MSEQKDTKYKDPEFCYDPQITGEHCFGDVTIREFADKEAYEYYVSLFYDPADPDSDYQVDGSCSFTLEYEKGTSVDMIASDIADAAECEENCWFTVDRLALAQEIDAAFEIRKEDIEDAGQ